MENQKSSKVVNIVLWVFQGLLAAMFIMAGASKLFQTISELANSLPWVTEVPEGLVRFIGISELLGGLGLLLPSLLRIKPILTPVAALGLAAVMVLASIFHISRGETSVIGMNFVIMAIALFVAWGRMKKAPIHAK
jgi:putative oxidoreductase